MTKPGHIKKHVQTIVGTAAETELDFGFIAEKLTISVTASTDLSVDPDNVPAASGFLILQTTAAPFILEEVYTQKVSVISNSGNSTVTIMAEMWDIKEAMGHGTHPDTDPYNWRRTANAATRVGTAADGDT